MKPSPDFSAALQKSIDAAKEKRAWDGVAIIQADARRIPLADTTVQCVVTSPPYWGLRKYSGTQELIWPNGARTQGIVRCNRADHLWSESDTKIDNNNGNGEKSTAAELRFNKESRYVEHRAGTCTLCGAWRGGYGLEPTIEMYIAHTVEILREIRRVLRPDGVVFWNIGDSYCNGTSTVRPGSKNGAVGGWSGEANQIARNGIPLGLKPKDLCLIPARVAIAAQADGWWVRSLIIWAKPNPMPESCTDRPTDAYEHIIMLTKSERYFWDADAVREPSNGNTYPRGNGDGGPKARERANEGTFEGWCDGTREVLTSRNLRNVWMFPTQPYPGAHFATFPEEIPRRCILAATSERGACVHCGAPWQRIVEASGGTIGKGAWTDDDIRDVAGKRMITEINAASVDGTYQRETTGWEPPCECIPSDEEIGRRSMTRPCIVLDPFGGSGTTARVAVELNRRAVSIDLAYHDHAKERTRNVQRSLAAL